MLKIDHLTIIAPSLNEGATHVLEQLVIVMPEGGEHPQMGTHNLLLRLSDELFLEVIAVNPNAKRPQRNRWFGLDNTENLRAKWDNGNQLNGWVAQTTELDCLLASHGDLLGQKTFMSRGNRNWHITVPEDGSLPLGGIAPSVLDWGPLSNPAKDMTDHGAKLVAFIIEHPDPERIKRIYNELGLITHPEIRFGTHFRYLAMIDTKEGIKTLT